MKIFIFRILQHWPLRRVYHKGSIDFVSVLRVHNNTCRKLVLDVLNNYSRIFKSAFYLGTRKTFLFNLPVLKALCLVQNGVSVLVIRS